MRDNMILVPIFFGACLFILALIVISSVENEEYQRYVSSIRSSEWCKGTYEQAVKVWERELNDTRNDVSFCVNEYSISNPDGTHLFNFRIKIANVSMLLSKKDYFKYKSYVLQRSRDPIPGKERQVSWEG